MPNAELQKQSGEAESEAERSATRPLGASVPPPVLRRPSGSGARRKKRSAWSQPRAQRSSLRNAFRTEAEEEKRKEEKKKRAAGSV